MKKNKYIKPEIRCVALNSQSVLANSFVDIGGEGKLDVRKRDRGYSAEDWTDETDSNYWN